MTWQRQRITGRHLAHRSRGVTFSLQISPSPIQMADAQEEQLNIQTLSTNAMSNTKKRRHDIIHIYDAWLNSMALHNSHT